VSEFSDLLDVELSSSKVRERVERAKLRILTIDIENSPNIAHVWGLFKQNVSLSQLQESARTISFAAKWYGEPEVQFYSEYHHGHQAMVEAAWKLVNEADMVVGYNSKNFDMKHLNREFLEAGLGPVSSYKDIDLLQAARSRFRLTSNKLDYVAGVLGLGSKTAHEGHSLWVKCMAGDPDAWERMKEYNMQDVVLTEKVYDALRPWIKGHPHMGLFLGKNSGCPNCGSDNARPAGVAMAIVTAYNEYRCMDCQYTYRSTRRVDAGKLSTRRIIGN